MRITALVTLLAGAAGSLGYLFRFNQGKQPLLFVTFIGWVLAPFVALIVADMRARHWAPGVRTTLYAVMVAVAAGSVAAYAVDASRQPHPQGAFAFTIVPPATWLLAGLVMAVAAVIARRSAGTNRHA